MEKAFLVLENGKVFAGRRFGAARDAVGDLVFTTGAGAYVETLSDPGHFGQIAIQTFPLIGNYGWIPEDAESGNCFMRGYVVRELCAAPSNFRAQGSLDAYLKAQGVPGICGVDTRALTKLIREEGEMKAALCDNVGAGLAALQSDTHENALAAVSCQAPYTVGEGKTKLALLDYGTKRSVIEALAMQGYAVTVLPYDTTAQSILAGGYRGVVLSGGAGEPSENAACIEEIEKLLGKLPIFAEGLGHNMLALAAGAKCYKLKHGHRGANQPVRDSLTGRILVTSQNHGYAVDASTLPDFARLRFVNVNDGSCEGIDYPEYRASSVQFAPDGCGLEAACFYEEFIKNMQGVNGYAAQ